MSKALAELNALCDVLSYMRTPIASYSANQMYHYFCNPGTGTTSVVYGTDDYGKIFCVHFLHITRPGFRHEVSISTIKSY